jgi:hypothetical protein
VFFDFVVHCILAYPTLYEYHILSRDGLSDSLNICISFTVCDGPDREKPQAGRALCAVFSAPFYRTWSLRRHCEATAVFR